MNASVLASEFIDQYYPLKADSTVDIMPAVTNCVFPLLKKAQFVTVKGIHSPFGALFILVSELPID